MSGTTYLTITALVGFGALVAPIVAVDSFVALFFRSFIVVPTSRRVVAQRGGFVPARR